MSETEARALVQKAAASGVQLRVEDGQLRYQAGTGRLTGLLRSELQSRKNQLIGELSLPVFRKRPVPLAVVSCPTDRIGFWKECESNKALRHGTHFAVRVTGRVGREHLDSAFERLAARHDLMRSTLNVKDDGIPFLRLEDRPAPAGFMDLSGVPAARSSAEIETAVEHAIYAPFENGRICRAQVMRISQSAFVVVAVIHHFVVDALSVEIVVRDFMAGLQSGADRRSPNEERPLQYADYLSGMAEWQDGPGLAYRVQLWKDRMRGAQAIRFPLRDDGEHAANAELGVIAIQVARELRHALARTTSKIGVPLSTALLAANLAALAITLRRRDVFTMVLYLGRDDPALFDMVGSTIGSIPVRVAIDSRMSFEELLRHVHEAFVFAVAYRIPWGVLRPALGEAGTSHAAPFLNYRSFARPEAAKQSSGSHGADFRKEPLAFRRPAHNHIVDWKSYDLQAVDTGAEIHISVRYLPSVFQTAPLKAFADTFLVCLEALANAPARRVCPDGAG